MSKGRNLLTSRFKESKRLESKIEREAIKFRTKHPHFVPPVDNPRSYIQSNERGAHFFRTFEKGSLRR